MDTHMTFSGNLIAIGMLCLQWTICQSQPKELNEVCEATFRPSCEEGHVILMTHAQYGRMRLGKCVVKDYGSIGCSSDVLEIVDKRCSGASVCEIVVPSRELSDTKPCPHDLKPYLEVAYSCVKVNSPQHACPPDRPIHLDFPSGFISSGFQSNLNCGTDSTPYRINTKPGQEIILTIYNFKITNHQHHNRFQCDSVAKIIEHHGGKKSSSEICRGLTREKEVLRTRSNKVDIVLNDSSRSHQQLEYMIYYEVVGCPSLAPIPAAVVTKAGNDVTVTCNFTSEVYTLTCHNNEWSGNLKNCSRVAHPQNGDFEDSEIPYGVSIFIVIIIALVIGLVVLIFGLLFLRRRNQLCGPRFPRPQTEHTDKDYASYYQTSTYARKPPGTDLPPCTPLMVPESQIYAQRTNADRLACGCPVYMSRDEVQNQQNECCRNASVNGGGNNTTTDYMSSLSHPDRLTIGPDMVPIHERQIFMNTLPNSPKRLSHHSTFKPASSDPSETVEINGIKAKTKDTKPQDTAVVLSENNRRLLISQSNGQDTTSRVLVSHNSSDTSEPSDSEASAFMPRH